jgi:hypothetical protein
MKLHRSKIYASRWFAFSPETGWVMFPAERNGWRRRQPARGFDPIDVREVPIRLGFNTGLPGSPDLTETGDDSTALLPEAA